MRFSINRELLTSKLSAFTHVVPQTSPQVEITGIYIQVFQDHIVLTGTDTKSLVQVIIAPDEENQLVIEETGSIVVKATALTELIRRLNGDTVLAETIDDSQIRFYGPAGGKFDLIGFPGSSYPILDIAQPSTHLTLPARIFSEISRQISFAAAVNHARVILNGINFQIKDHKLVATATNTYTLARKTVPVLVDDTLQITIPAKALSAVSALADGEQDVDLYLDTRKIQFVIGDTLYQTSLLDGVYPDCDRLLSVKPVTQITLDVPEFEGIISRTSIYTADKSTSSGIIPVQMDYAADNLSLQVFSSVIGECREFVENFDLSGKEGKIAFNAAYMISALKSVHGNEKIVLSLGGPGTALNITVPDDPSLQMLMVPIRTR